MLDVLVYRGKFLSFSFLSLKFSFWNRILLQAVSSGHAVLFTSPPPVEYPQIISILFLVRHSKPMQALPSIFMSMTLYVTGKNSMTLCVTASMTLCVTAKFCMTLCVTAVISLKIGCMTQKCMTQKYRPYEHTYILPGVSNLPILRHAILDDQLWLLMS